MQENILRKRLPGLIAIDLVTLTTTFWTYRGATAIVVSKNPEM